MIMYSVSGVLYTMRSFGRLPAFTLRFTAVFYKHMIYSHQPFPFMKVLNTSKTSFLHTLLHN